MLVCISVVAAPALAQEQREKPRSLLEFLFRGGEVSKPKKEPPVAAKPKKRTSSKASASRQPEVVELAAVDKQTDAKVVLVVGDFMGGGLAEGLTAFFSQNAAVRVVDRTNGSSGFVRNDFYNWPEEIKTLIDTEKPSAVVVMLGSNDRQQMKVGEVREAALAENWIKEYETRAASLGASIKTKGVPFIWVGLPAFKSKKMSSDMLAFNDTYRKAAEASGGEFIDIWDGFVDENGAYVSNGPDMNGQPVKLRANDGINLTRPGKRKVAFYTEKPLGRILGGSASPSVGLPGALPGAPAEPGTPVPVDRTVPVSLNDPELDGGMELLGLKVDAKDKPRTPGEKLAIEGIAPDATPGRADNFLPAAPRQLAEPAAPVAPAETTTAIRQ